jgi:hypothetical protein
MTACPPNKAGVGGTMYLNCKYKLISLIFLHLSLGAVFQLHLNIKVRDLRDIPCFVETLKNF